MNNQQNETYMANVANSDMGLKAFEELIEETKTPMEVTTALLMKLLDDNKDTEYGKKYGFKDIKTIEEYKEKVPVIVYDDIAEMLERMLDGEKNILTAYEVGHMNETSGTVGNPKIIPLTEEQTNMFAKYNNLSPYGLMRADLDPDWLKGRAFCTSSGNCRTAPSGITVGEASAKMADYVKGGRDGLDTMIRTLYTSPIEGLNPEPGSDVKYIHARFAMIDPEVRGLITGFYSVAVLYLQYIADNYNLLIDDIEKGTIDPSINLSKEVRDSLMKKIKPDPERALQLREVFKDGPDVPFVTRIWPNFQYIMGAGGDGFSVYDELIKNRFVDREIKNIYSGVTASEGLWSAPVDINNTGSVICPGASFVEFLPVECGSDFSKCKTLDQVEIGKTYELIITNQAGLYRYRMSDAVKVVDFYNNTPRVEFMYRVNKTINIAEEKTTEKALLQTVQRVAEETGFTLADFSVYPDTSVTPGKYIFLIEPLYDARGFDMKKLQECVYKHLIEANPVYKDCYDDNWLDLPEVHFLQPQTSLLYKDMMIMRGASLNQLKPVRIIVNERQRKFFFNFIDYEAEQ